MDRCPHCGSQRGWSHVRKLRAEQCGVWGSQETLTPHITCTWSSRMVSCISCNRRVLLAVATGEANEQ